jgi:hypothetical protein
MDASIKTLEWLGHFLWDTAAGVNRRLGCEIPVGIRVPIGINLVGWEFTGTWVVSPLFPGWELEGVLDVQGYEPHRVHLSQLPRKAVRIHAERVGHRQPGLEAPEGQPEG